MMFRYDFTDKEIIDKIIPNQKRDNPEGSDFLVFVLPTYFQVQEPFEELKGWLIARALYLTSSNP